MLKPVTDDNKKPILFSDFLSGSSFHSTNINGDKSAPSNRIPVPNRNHKRNHLEFQTLEPISSVQWASLK